MLMRVTEIEDEDIPKLSEKYFTIKEINGS